MDAELAIEQLKEQLYFEDRTAKAYVRAKGHCEYCGQDLIKVRLGYACAQIDHLLPRSRFPEAVWGMSENFVLACSLCNGVKRDEVVLQKGEVPEAMLSENRKKLVDRAKNYIDSKLQSANDKWRQAQAIFSTLDNKA
ncbi:MAG: HNH endonuclease [Stenotrophobium sp.]